MTDTKAMENIYEFIEGHIRERERRAFEAGARFAESDPVTDDEIQSGFDLYLATKEGL